MRVDYTGAQNRGRHFRAPSTADNVGFGRDRDHRSVGEVRHSRLLGFLVGAGLSYLSFRSWVRLAATIGDSGKRPATGSAVFLALRYVLIGVAIYATIRGLGSTPGALIVGLLVSFAALALELLWGAVGPK